ncbi:unnamed protein product, partial [Laminaria digitata]
VPEAVQEAVRTFRAPPGYTVAAIGGSKRKKHSITAYYGVRLELKPPGGEAMPAGKRRQKWACLASHECRCQQNFLSIHSDSTTGATQHLSDAHNIQSAVAAAGTKR